MSRKKLLQDELDQVEYKLNCEMNWFRQEIVNKAYLKIQKKIHPDVSPETARLSTIVNEAKEIVLQDIS